MTDRKNPVAGDDDAAVAERRAKLARLREEGNPYPNDFARTHTVRPIVAEHRDSPADVLAQRQVAVVIAGRLMSKRAAGETSYGIVEDATGRIQIAVSDEASGKANHAAYAQWDPGDILGIEGILYKTPEGELTIRAHALRLLAKALRAPPARAPDAGARYAELMVDPDARRLLAVRSRTLQAVRRLFSSTQYMEVETPMLQPMPGVGAARGFQTHHNALDLTLTLRASAMPYLARLAVGGLEKIFEINRGFHDDGAFAEQGYERTVMEIFCAYSGHDYMMGLLELVIARAAKSAIDATAVRVKDQEIELGRPFSRIRLGDALRRHGQADWSDAALRDRAFLERQLGALGVPTDPAASWGSLQVQLFLASAAPRLVQPAFVTDFPRERFALARPSGADPALAEGFELFIGGRPIAHGASIINDSAALDAGVADPQFVRALEYGLPPASGATLSLDALAMLLTGSASLRDVVAFPAPQR
ncbi:MAG: amino acid--tRNA ligase-related protein [Burkholderiales bacterium]|nr:amino acid--tRNA ligase-related protein [Burkholderiales bacterium]